jgi:hypothetical protein
MKRFLAAALLSVCVLGRASADPAAPRVLELDGRLGGRKQFLNKGDELSLDAPFWVSKGGRAVLRVAGGVVLIKGPAHFVPKLDGFVLKLGSLLSVLPHLDGRAYRVRTPAAVAAVRGTEFFVQTGRKGATYLCLCRGAVDVAPASRDDAPPARIKSDHHAGFEFRDDGGRLVQAPAGMRGHTDDELASLRALAQ